MLIDKVYIAAPWAEREHAKWFGELIERISPIRVTRKWWDYEGDTPEMFEEQAQADLQGVMDADVLVLLNTQKRGEETSGKAVETGIALMNCIPIYATGVKGTNIFQYLDDFTWFPTLDLLREELLKNAR